MVAVWVTRVGRLTVLAFALIYCASGPNQGFLLAWRSGAGALQHTKNATLAFGEKQLSEFRRL